MIQEVFGKFSVAYKKKKQLKRWAVPLGYIVILHSKLLPLSFSLSKREIMNRARTGDAHTLDFLLPAWIAWLCIGGSLCNSLTTLDFDACWGLVTSKVVFPEDCFNMQVPGIRDAV